MKSKSLMFLGMFLTTIALAACSGQWGDPFDNGGGNGGGNGNGGGSGSGGGGCDTIISNPGDTVFFPDDSIDVIEWSDSLGGWVRHRIPR